MVGGAPVTAAYADEISIGYGANAGMAVERAKELVDGSAVEGAHDGDHRP